MWSKLLVYKYHVFEAECDPNIWETRHSAVKGCMNWLGLHTSAIMQAWCGYTRHIRRFSSHISSHSEDGNPAYATSLLVVIPGVGLIPIRRPELYIIHSMYMRSDRSGPYKDRQVKTTEPGRAVLNIGTRHSKAAGSIYYLNFQKSTEYIRKQIYWILAWSESFSTFDCKSEIIGVGKRLLPTLYLAALPLWSIPSTASSDFQLRELSIFPNGCPSSAEKCTIRLQLSSPSIWDSWHTWPRMSELSPPWCFCML